MFAITRRSRPRRSHRFVPGVDGLAPRITPVSFAPLECPIVDPAPPQEDEGLTEAQLEERAYGRKMAEMLRQLDALCRTTPYDV